MLAITRHKFYLPHYSTVKLCWTSSHLTKLTQLNTNINVDFSTMHSPIQCDVLMHMQCNAPLHVISCHMYNECYMDNSNHIIHHVSWTIILIAYNFHTITHSMSIYLYTHISTSYHPTTTKHVIQNQATTPLILEAKCDKYYAHKIVRKTAPRQATKPTIHRLQSCSKQDVKTIPNSVP